MKIKLENGTIVDLNVEACVIIFDNDEQVIETIEMLSTMEPKQDSQRKLAIFPHKWGSKKQKDIFMEKGKQII